MYARVTGICVLCTPSGARGTCSSSGRNNVITIMSRRDNRRRRSVGRIGWLQSLPNRCFSDILSAPFWDTGGCCRRTSTESLLGVYVPIIYVIRNVVENGPTPVETLRTNANVSTRVEGLFFFLVVRYTVFRANARHAALT